MALMRKGRMTVKTTTKPVSKPSSDRFTTGKSGVKTTPTVTVTGKKETGNYTAEEEYKRHYRHGDYNQYVAGVGKKTKHTKLSPSELEKYNKDSLKNRSSKLIAKEVRVQSNLSPEDRQESTRFGGYQVDYYDPTKDKAVYDRYAEKSKAVVKAGALTNPGATTKSTKPAESTYKKPAESTRYTNYSNPSQKRPVEMVYKAIEAPAGKTKSFKKQGSVTNRLKSQGGLAGGAEGRKYRKEEKLAGAYTRTKEAIQKKGDDASWNMGLSPKNKTKQAMLKDFKGELRTTKKSATDKGTKKAAKSSIKDVRKSQRFEKKEMAGKINYFTKSRMAEQVEKTPSMTAINQAGKTRYKK